MKLQPLLLSLTLLLSPAVPAATAVFAGGCFWCMEADFEPLDGVSAVVSGFTGGTVENPTYNGDHRGHYEAIEVSYDPAVVSYEELLDHYWTRIDPFDDRGQFCDKGPSYRAAVFVADAQERELAEASKRAVEQRFPTQAVVTPILNASTFYPVQGSEAYHQDFAEENPFRYWFFRWRCGRDQRLEEIWGPQTDS